MILKFFFKSIFYGIEQTYRMYIILHLLFTVGLI